MLYDHHMRTSVRILISGIIAILAGLNLLLFAAYMHARHRPLPDAVPPALPLVAEMLIAALALWGIFTGIGLFWHKPWARISIQVFAIAVALQSLLAGSGALVALRSLISIHADPATMRSAYARTAIFPAQIAIAIWWLILFNTRRTKAEFTARGL
jgi:hypothetical protein